VLIAVERLLIKLRQPRSRAGELIELHARLRAEVDSQPDAEEQVLAREIRDRKLKVSALLAGVTSCSSCATGHPPPVGQFIGGACCAGNTADLFDDNELAMLAHAGTRRADLRAPRSEHAGCAFRGDRGCTLEAAHRPARCIHFACDTLRRELHAKKQLVTLERDLAELNRSVQRFRTVRGARTDRQVMAPLLAAIADARRQR